MSKFYLFLFIAIFSANSYSSVSVCHSLVAKEARLLVDLEHKLELEKTYIADGFVLLFKESAAEFQEKVKSLEFSFKQNNCRNFDRLQTKRDFYAVKLYELNLAHQSLINKSAEISEKTICEIGLERLKNLYSEVVDHYEDKTLNNFDLFQEFSRITFEGEFFTAKTGCFESELNRAKEMMSNSYLMMTQLKTLESDQSHSPRQAQL